MLVDELSGDEEEEEEEEEWSRTRFRLRSLIGRLRLREVFWFKLMAMRKEVIESREKVSV